ncbi:CCA tRNA nucleotidyltransferase [Halobium salinum]|uniref:CCA-adding enzyme n=1 Tax=Halobium salinum TaxID=1364940 RepID=A0ABD5PCM3_9EURY|nr:CCA tRNA nucleotidyltransferase [Halobium salinum]
MTEDDAGDDADTGTDAGAEDDLSRVVAGVRDRVTPDVEEATRLAEAADDLVARVEAALADLPVDVEDVDTVQVGSTARGTWLAGDRDIDLFVRFPGELPRDDLESYGLQVGRAVLPDGREEFAEHPYVTGAYDGFDVDLVPCYDVPDATGIRSAVDRTPFHNAYLAARLDEDLAGDVRVFKRFLKAIGAYGSDLRTEGFSGYLAELLVFEHGGFVPLLEAAADWHPPVRFDPEDHGRAAFDHPLVVIDPTDPERNVAAVCSAENVARLQHYARDLLADPREGLFFRDESGPEHLDADAVREHVRRRETTPVAVVFDTPDVVEDQLYPQLRKSLDGIQSELTRRGFGSIRAETFAAETTDELGRQAFGRAVLLVELEVAKLPAVERHEGPPVHVDEHARGFYEAYADDPDVYGPFLDGDRYVVEREREFTSAVGFVESDSLFDVALGVHVAESLNEGYEVLAGEEVAELAEHDGVDGEAFGVELARYLDPEP